MLKIFLWLRYLRKKKIVLLSIAAVALSVSLLIVVASLFDGFIRAFEQSAVQAVGDIVLAAPEGKTISRYPLLIERLQQLSVVQAATATLSAQGLLHLGKGNVRAVNIWGIEADRRNKVADFKQYMLKQKDSPGDPSFAYEGSADRPGGFLGIAVIAEPDENTDQYDFDLARQMLGQEVYITTGTVVEQDVGDTKLPKLKRKLIRFVVADIVFTGIYDLDKRFVYLPIDHLQKAIYPDQQEPLANQIQIRLAPGTDADSALAQIRGVWQVFAEDQLGWPSYLARYTEIETARQMQSRFVAELRKQMGVLLVIFGVVSFSVVVLIFCIFYMIVTTKQKDIAIIKSCGAAAGSVAFIFLGFGLCVGLAGSAIGAVLGYVITRNINVIEDWVRVIFGLKLWKSSVYMFSKIPNEVDWASAVDIVLLAVAASAIGTVIPAIVAARTRPVEILRYE